jgi:hypothetical protein
MSIYPDLTSGQADVADNIGNQTEPRSITPSSHSGVLNNIAETMFQYSAGTGEDTLVSALLDSSLTLLHIPEGTFTSTGTEFKIEKTANLPGSDNQLNEWRTIVAQGNVILEKADYNTPQYNLNLENLVADGDGRTGKFLIWGLTLEGKATEDAHFDQSSPGIFIANNTSTYSGVDDIRIFFCTIKNQSTQGIVCNKSNGVKNFDLFFNSLNNVGRGGYIVHTHWGMWGFNRADINGDDALAINSSSTWNNCIGNIFKRASALVTDDGLSNNGAVGLKINSYASSVFGNITYAGRGHSTSFNHSAYDDNQANQTYGCSSTVIACNIGHAMSPKDAINPTQQMGHTIDGTNNLFFGNLNNTVQYIDHPGSGLGYSVGTIHDSIKLREFGRIDIVNETFEGGYAWVSNTRNRHIRFKNCKFLNWQGHNNNNWYDLHAVRLIGSRKSYRIDFIDCEFENSCGCIIRLFNDAIVNRVNVINCSEFQWNNVAELAGDEDSSTTIDIDDTVTTLDISRVANHWKGWNAAWASGQEFYLCTYDSNQNIVYDTITIAEKVYPNMGTGNSVTINVEEFTATNQYVQKDSWLALKKRAAIDTKRGIAYGGTNTLIDTIHVVDKTFLGASDSLSGWQISDGGGLTVNTTILNGEVVSSTTVIA